MLALVEELSDESCSVSAKSSVFRPNRDTRFSKDKSPYKTNAAAVIQRDDGGSLYLSLSVEGLHVGGGGYHLDAEQLVRFRAAIDADRSGTELEGLAADLRAQKADVTAHTVLKTAPRGFRSDHPRIDLLRLGGIIGIWALPPRAWLYSAKAAPQVAERWRSLDPLNGWIARHVGPSTMMR